MNLKRVTFTFLRICGVLLGLFLTLSTLAEIAGLVPHSLEMPPLSTRVMSALPGLLAGIVLLIPHRLITGRTALIVLSAAYVCVLLGLIAKSMVGIGGFAAGDLHWAVIPVSVVFTVIVLGNLLALRETRAAKALPAA